MTEQLKPCPFCGKKPEIIGYDDEMYQVICRDCDGTQDTFFDSPEEAAKAWNTRPIEDELHGKIGKLESENKRLKKKLDEALRQRDFNAGLVLGFQERVKKQREALEKIARGFDSDSRDYKREQMMRIAAQALKGEDK